MSINLLIEAVKEKDIEIIEILLKKVDVNAKDYKDRTPLHWAAIRGYKDVAELLIDKGADVNAKDIFPEEDDPHDDRTPLHWAAIEGHTDVAKLLIDNGADVNAKDTPFYSLTENGRTPLHEAAENGHSEIEDLLRQNGGKQDE